MFGRWDRVDGRGIAAVTFFCWGAGAMRPDRVKKSSGTTARWSVLMRLAVPAAMTLLLVSSRGLATGAFDEELGTDVEAIAKKVEFDMSGWGKVHGSKGGGGQIPYLQALGHPPKRVALVSFYAYDPGDTKGFGSPYFGGRTETTRQLTKDGASTVATILHDQGIAAFKEQFKAHGMELLTPDEFADTDAKRAFYENFEMKVGLGVKLFKSSEGGGKENKLSKNQVLSAVAPGYRLFRLVYGENIRPMRSVDGKISVSMGSDLPKGLGVDAVVVVCNYCKATKKEGRLEGIYLYMFGPNPVPGEDTATYWPGHLYVGLRLDGIDVPMLGFGKSEQVSSSGSVNGSGGWESSALSEAGIVSVDVAGYERALAAIGMRAASFIEEWSTKKED